MSQNRFFHIVPDDKFIDIAISVFNDVGGDHQYFCIKNDCDSFTFIHSTIVQKKSRDEMILLLQSSTYSVVFFHTLFASYYPLVLQVPADKTVVWLSWGADLYYSFKQFKPLLPINLYKPDTQRLFFSNNSSPYTRLRKTVKNVVLFPRSIRLAREQHRRDLLQANAIHRVDYCSTVLKSEYESLSHCPFFRAKFFPFRYSQKENSSIQISNQADYILIGNSADLSGNHFDVLRELHEKKISNPLLIPLSYGNRREELISLVKQRCKQSDIFLTDFLNYSDYCAYISKCRAAIFGHLRQQALGNIKLCLKSGIRVFLYKDSMVFKYFSKAGFIIYSIEEDLTPELIQTIQDASEVQHNRMLLEELFGYNHVIKALRAAIHEISE